MILALLGIKLDIKAELNGFSVTEKVKSYYMACDLSLGSIASVMHLLLDMIGAISKPAVLHDLLDWNVAVSFSS